MDRATLEKALFRVAYGPLGEPPVAIGRMPQDVARVTLGWTEPVELEVGEVALVPAPRLGPAYALGDALLAHPDRTLCPSRADWLCGN